jgi:hypothetical protein
MSLPLALLFWALWIAFVFVIIAFAVRWGMSMWWTRRCYHEWDAVSAEGVECRHCRKRIQADKVRSQLARQAATAPRSGATSPDQ